MFGFFQFGVPQLGDAPFFDDGEILGGGGGGITQAGLRRQQAERRRRQEIEIESTLLVFLNTQD